MSTSRTPRTSDEPARPERPDGVARLLREHASTLLSSVGVYLAQSAGFAAGLATNILISRTLGPGGQGEYFLIITTSGLASALTSLGIEGVLTLRGAAPGPAAAAEVNGLLLGFTLAQMFLFLLLGGIGFLFRSDIGVLLLTGGMLAALLSFQNGFTVLATARRDLRYLNTFHVIGPSLNLIAAATLRALGRCSPLAFAAVILAANAGSAAAMGGLLGRSRGGFRIPKTLYRERRLLLRVAAGVYASNMAVMARERLNVYLLAAFGGKAAVGLFSIAWTLAQKMVAGADAVATVMTRRLIRCAPDDVLPLVRRTLAALAFPLIPVFLLAVFLGGWIIPILWGGAYAPAVPAFRILAWTFVFYLPSRLLAVVLSYNRVRPELTATLGWLAVLVTLPLAVWLNAEWGLIGASCAVVVRAAVDLAFLACTLRRIRPCDPASGEAVREEGIDAGTRL